MRDRSGRTTAESSHAFRLRENVPTEKEHAPAGNRTACAVVSARMRKLVGFAFVALGAAAAGRVHADDTVVGTRFELAERSHVIDLHVDRGYATLVVTRVIENAGPRSDQAVFQIEVPESAVATRLRTAGVDAKGQPVWFEGEL